MSGATCLACKDEPVLAGGDLCARCAYVVRGAAAEQRARAERAERQAADLAKAVREIDVLTDARWRLATERGLDAALQAIQAKARAALAAYREGR